MTETPITHVSDTALWVAAFRAIESDRPDALFQDSLAAALTGDKGRAIANSMPHAKITAWMMAIRTIAIDQLIYQAIDAGAETVINIGAGLDTRPYRLDLPKNLRWVEIDFPHMITWKNEKLAGESPRCHLERFGLDVADRDIANRLYRELGTQTKKALVITEGVIPYLANDEAGKLAQDLYAVPTFKFWIQDYYRASKSMRRSQKMNEKMKNAPFKFEHADPLAFFGGYGWKIRHKINAFEEAAKYKRPFPVPFPWSLLMRLLPRHRRETMRTAMGYVLFER